MNALAPISTFKVELVTLASIFIFSAVNPVCTPPPPPPLSPGGWGGIEPLTNLKSGSLTGPQFLEGGCWERLFSGVAKDKR